MFILTTSTGSVVRMKNGEPFLYSSRDLARTAKKLLENEKTGILSVKTA